MREEIFTELPISVLVDLYEYVESMNFDNIEQLLGETYRSKIESRDQLKVLEDIVAIMRNQEVTIEGYPSVDGFKLALHRFVFRKVLTELVDKESTLKEHLCSEGSGAYWNREMVPLMGNFDEVFLRAMELKLKHLSSLLVKMPFAGEDGDEEEEEPVPSRGRRSNRMM